MRLQRKCLICECDLRDEPDLKQFGSVVPIVYDATIFRSHGNFGSSVFDPIGGDEFLEMYLCDTCIEKKKHLIFHVDVVKKREEDVLVKTFESSCHTSDI